MAQKKNYCNTITHIWPEFQKKKTEKPYGLTQIGRGCLAIETTVVKDNGVILVTHYKREKV